MNQNYWRAMAIHHQAISDWKYYTDKILEALEMGMVTDVTWTCPGCESVNNAQLYDDHYPDTDSDERRYPLPRKAIPSDASLKWSPPCIKCGKYKLAEPPVVLVEFPIERVE